MMPDLGKYASEVYTSYAVTAVLLAAIIVATVLKGRKVAAELRDAEERRTKNGTDQNG
ncbi:heme exporter protein CcmD [Falsihalocynthiibacter sp. SS001]|uniref:heme exporter protein CcmD n=1 Tax=Falsihalocynthiibacter sp. SS001 TaxID=3349698 RepID=UPI0036D344CB